MPWTSAMQQLQDAAAAQDQVVSRKQALDRGVQRWSMRAHCQYGRWQLVGRQAVVLHNGPLTKEQRWWCALINTAPGAALAGLTAAEAGGLAGFESNEIHVVVVRGARPRRSSNVRVHESRRLRPADIHPVLQPPRTRLSRSVLDAALWSNAPHQACAIVVAAVQQRLVRSGEIHEELVRIKRHRFRRVLLAVLADVSGGAQALGEVNFARLCRNHGLPCPRRQSVRQIPGQRRRYLDVEWPEYSLAVEIDGFAHTLAQNWWDDMDRHNEVVLEETLLLRFPSVAVHTNPDRVLEQVRRGLVRGGWRPGNSSAA